MNVFEKVHGMIVRLLGGLTDAERLEMVELHDSWNPDWYYHQGDIAEHGGSLYRCLMNHISQEDWQPEFTPSLWAKLLTEQGSVLPWQQPESTNPYAQGDRVTHNGKTWQSAIDNNVWEPGVYGWEEMENG